MSSTPTTSTTIDIAASHYPQLDGLRGLAILLVVVFHFSMMHSGFLGNDPGFFLQFMLDIYSTTDTINSALKDT